MKKSLIALAVLSTIAGSVAAQSSVTVYGRLDAGYKDYSTTTTAGVKTSTQNISNSAFTSSRLGFMGTEDLGGGLKAGFTFEGNLQASAGTTGSNDATAFNTGRHQFLTLSSANMGSLLVGKTDSLVKQVFDGYDAGYSNNLTGAFDSMTGGSGIVGNRRDQVVRYTSPKFSNIDVSIGLMDQSSDSTTASATTEDNSGYELAARYAAGKLSLAGAYRSADTKTNGTAAVTAAAKYAAANAALGLPVGSTVVFAGAGDFTATAAGAAADTTTNTMALGASYNFGPAVGFVQYFDQEDKNNVAGTKTDLDAVAVGVRVPMGKATLFASYTDGDAAQAGASKTSIEGMQLGVKYDLSKRTYAYVAYGEKEEQVTGEAKSKAENLAIGIAHHF